MVLADRGGPLAFQRLRTAPALLNSMAPYFSNRAFSSAVRFSRTFRFILASPSFNLALLLIVGCEQLQIARLLFTDYYSGDYREYLEEKRRPAMADAAMKNPAGRGRG